MQKYNLWRSIHLNMNHIIGWTGLIFDIPLERYTSCSNSRLTIFSYPPRVAIVSAFTPRRLQIDGSAPFWSNSFTHSKWPSRQACINGDHPYLFKASKYSGYCKISSLAMKCSKNGINHIQHKDQFSHSEILNLSSWIWFFVWQRYSEISDINHSAKLPYYPT